MLSRDRINGIRDLAENQHHFDHCTGLILELLDECEDLRAALEACEKSFINVRDAGRAECAKLREKLKARTRELAAMPCQNPTKRFKADGARIGPLQQLARPSVSRKLRRVTFIPTTLARLLNANEINDLWDGGSLQDELWAALKTNDIT